MHVQYLSTDPVASGVSAGFGWGGVDLSVSEATTGLGSSADPADGLLYDYTTHGTDGVADLRRFRAERPGVPVVGVVDTIAGVGDVPAALEPHVDGWIEKATVDGEPRRVLSTLRYASAHSLGDGHSAVSAAGPDTDGDGPAGEGRSTTTGDPDAPEEPHPDNLRRVLRAKDRRLAELAEGLSHDLQNPLMVASEYADLARETGDEEYLVRAIDAIDRASDLVEGLSVLADTGRGLAVLVAVPIATIAEDTWESVGTGSATLSVGTDRVVHGDPRLLGRLFEAVFENAVEHGGPDVAVRVGTNELGFYVEDDGPGIEPERREALRSGSDGPDRPAGTGFAVVRDAAAVHGWTLSLTESPTGGLRIELAV